MAAFRLRLYEAPREEVRWTREGDVPRWVLRLYQSYGWDPATAPLSTSVEALAQGLAERLKALALTLRKMEARGWSVRLEGDRVLAASDLTREAMVAALHADGVWTVVRELACRDETGGIRWL